VRHIDVAGDLLVGAVVLNPLTEEDRAALVVRQADTAREAVELALVILVIAEGAAGRVNQRCCAGQTAESTGRTVSEDVIVGAQVLGTLIAHHRCVFLHLQGGNNIEIIDLFAPQQAHGILFHGAFLVAAIGAANPDAIIFLDGNQVDHAGHRVRTVQCGPAVQHDFHAAQGDIGHHGAHFVTVDDATAIEQGQCAAGAQAAQVEAGRVAVLTAAGAAEDVGHGVDVVRVNQIAHELTGAHRAG
jgi:hypothetical protein